MPHGKTALTLMIALALPGAAAAVGLGDIHLESALNEPLAAEIDIVGATAEDLAGITASIADRETFEHFDVDRAAFLSTVVFKVSRDSRGRAVLAIRSTEACTEPLVNMLVDLRWRGGELIRQYALLLDPPGFASAVPVAEPAMTAPVSASPAVANRAIEPAKPAMQAARISERASAPGEPVARKTVRVGAKATLRGIAWRVGSRSEADLTRMMIAIFRANPGGFEGNINRLRRGAVLTIPTATEASAISVADANHDVHAQMQAWHAATPGTGARLSQSAAPGSSSRESAVPSSPAAGTQESSAPTVAASAGRTAAASVTPSEAALDHRVRQLEKRLDELQDQFDREHDALLRAQERLNLVETAPAAVASTQVKPGRGIGPSIAAILGLAAAALGISAWRRRRARDAPLSRVEPTVPHRAVSPSDVREAAAPSTPLRVEPRAVAVEPSDSSNKTIDALPAAPAKAVERQWVADVLTGRRDSIATESHEAANPEHAVDLETLEASYLLEGFGVDIDDTVTLRDMDQTANLTAPGQPVDDPNADTIPGETMPLVQIPESKTQAQQADENVMSATLPIGDATKLDYNLLDLDGTVQHVQMPSALHENVGFKERRTSLVDALKSAVAREPHRRDLRIKLLETYYAAAATNREGFLDTVRKIAQERASLNDGEWEKIAWMGRQIASDDDLFASLDTPPDEKDLVNCA
jgi:pilus assembly protein FimV